MLIIKGNKEDVNMWVSIRNNCVGCGACAIISPEVFEVRNRRVTVNQNRVYGNEDNCIDAAITCPVNAIQIDDY